MKAAPPVVALPQSLVPAPDTPLPQVQPQAPDLSILPPYVLAYLAELPHCASKADAMRAVQRAPATRVAWLRNYPWSHTLRIAEDQTELHMVNVARATYRLHAGRAAQGMISDAEGPATTDRSRELRFKAREHILRAVGVAEPEHVASNDGPDYVEAIHLIMERRYKRVPAGTVQLKAQNGTASIVDA